LLVLSLGLLLVLMVLVIVRKLRRDLAEAAAVGRRERYQSTLLHGDEMALRTLADEVRSSLSTQRDLALACEVIDPLPPMRLEHVHAALEPLERRVVRGLCARDPVVRGHALLPRAITSPRRRWADRPAAAGPGR
jgi:hypothetical protein